MRNQSPDRQARAMPVSVRQGSGAGQVYLSVRPSVRTSEQGELFKLVPVCQ